MMSVYKRRMLSEEIQYCAHGAMHYMRVSYERKAPHPFRR